MQQMNRLLNIMFLAFTLIYLTTSAIASTERTVGKVSEDQAEPAKKTLRQIQHLIKNKESERAWKFFTRRYIREKMGNSGFEGFKKTIETEALTKTGFLDLQADSVVKEGEVFILKGESKGKLWDIYFLNEDGQLKIDDLAALVSNWKKNLLPTIQKHVTEHFDIYYFKDSTAERELAQIAEEKESGFREISGFLGTKFDIRICMVLFEDGQTKYKATGHRGMGWGFDNTIVEIYNEKQKMDSYHETIHILMDTFGRPPALLSEGFAVYVSKYLSRSDSAKVSATGAELYNRARVLKNKGQLINLPKLLTYRDISRGDAYAEAGAFVKFLIDTHDKDKFLQAYKSLENSRDKKIQEKNIKILQQIYGKSLVELEREWESSFLK